MRPSGEKATDVTDPICPLKMRSSRPLVTSQNLIVPSQLPGTKHLVPDRISHESLDTLWHGLNVQPDRTPARRSFRRLSNFFSKAQRCLRHSHRRTMMDFDQTFGFFKSCKNKCPLRALTRGVSHEALDATSPFEARFYNKAHTHLDIVDLDQQTVFFRFTRCVAAHRKRRQWPGHAWHLSWHRRTRNPPALVHLSLTRSEARRWGRDGTLFARGNSQRKCRPRRKTGSRRRPPSAIPALPS